MVNAAYAAKIAGIGKDRTSSAIVRTALALAKELDLDVVAEGVETQEQADFLLAAGCTVMQGYFLSRPVDGPTATRVVAENAMDLRRKPGADSIAA